MRELEGMKASPAETFQQCLFRMIDARGLDDAEVYKRANLDRKLFSKIRCNEGYIPKKRTVEALVFGLRLTLPEARELLEKAGMAFTPSDRADQIIVYLLQNGCYDVTRDVNPILFQFADTTLGV